MKIKVIHIIVLGLFPIFMFVYGLLTLLGLVPTEELEFFEVNGFILMAYGMLLLLMFMSVNNQQCREVKKKDGV